MSVEVCESCRVVIGTPHELACDAIGPLLEFTVHGMPVPWMRTEGSGKRRFTPKRQRDYQRRVAHAALSAYRGAPLMMGPLRIHVSFGLEDRRPRDLDNLTKTIKDALNGIAWIDDAQVTSGSNDKNLASEPYAAIQIYADPQRASIVPPSMMPKETR